MFRVGPSALRGRGEAEEVLDACGVLESPEEGAGKAVPDPEVYHEAGSETAGRQPGIDGRPGKKRENLSCVFISMTCKCETLSTQSS